MSEQPLGVNVSKRAARKLARAASAPNPVASRSNPSKHHVKRAVKIALLLVLINYLGVPALVGVRKAITKLADVEFGWLALGLGLQFAALMAYTQLMRVALPKRCIGLFRLFRIQLSTKSINNVVPGGSAAGAALGYRLLTNNGVDGPAAGFALAATGLISAVVLNLLFWTALVISMPFYGFQPGYIIATLFGLGLLVFAATLGFALVRGEAFLGSKCSVVGLAHSCLDGAMRPGANGDMPNQSSDPLLPRTFRLPPLPASTTTFSSTKKDLAFKGKFNFPAEIPYPLALQSTRCICSSSHGMPLGKFWN